MNTIIFITYDSIFNSVFASQVIQPLQKRAEFNNEKIIIVSFEKETPSQEQIKLKIPRNFSFFCLKKFPFFGQLSLLAAITQLKKILQQFNSYSLIARGPIAGYIAIKACNNKCTNVTIQARGLLAEEYLYAHQHDIFIKKILHIPRFHLYKSLEREVYGNLSKMHHIEAVSNALKNFLITEYKADQQRISLAQYDIPPHFSPSQIKLWRKNIRTLLNIPSHKKVYCYSGSLHPWQCSQQTIDFFKSELQKNTECFLLILTHDVPNFHRHLQQNGLNSINYYVTSVEHHKIYHYLSAADYGLIFRENHIINWVSRPTKILEYQAVGMPIIHNNTIQMLQERV